MRVVQLNKPSAPNAGLAFSGETAGWSGINDPGRRYAASITFVKILVLAAAASLIVGCSHVDPIDKLLVQINHSPHNGARFPNGIWNYVFLPATATPEQLVAMIPHGTYFGELNTTRVKVLEVRRFRYFFDEDWPLDTSYSNPNYVAIMVKTDSDRKIVLANFQRWRTSQPTWETRVYDAK